MTEESYPVVRKARMTSKVQQRGSMLQVFFSKPLLLYYTGYLKTSWHEEEGKILRCLGRSPMVEVGTW